MSYDHMISINTFIDNSAECLDTLAITHSPLILIKNDTPVAVVQDIQAYQKLTNALCLLKLIAQGEEEIQEGKGRNQADVFADLDAMLEAKDV